MKPDRDAPSQRLPDWVVAVLLAEAASVIIALVVPLTPAKTGSEWSPAELITPEPSYLLEVAVTYVIVNLLILVLLGLGWVSVLRDRRGGDGDR